MEDPGLPAPLTGVVNASTPRQAIGALVFDVFGTIVDGRGNLIHEGQALR